MPGASTAAVRSRAWTFARRGGAPVDSRGLIHADRVTPAVERDDG